MKTKFILPFAVLAMMPHGVFADSRAAIKALQAYKKQLIEQVDTIAASFKDGMASDEQNVQLQAIQNKLEANESAIKAAEESARLSEIPEDQRFTAAYNPSPSELRDLERMNILGSLGGLLTGERPSGAMAALRQEGIAELQASGAPVSVSGGSLVLPARAVDYLRERAAIGGRSIRNATQSVTGTNLGSQFVGADVMANLLERSSLLPQAVTTRAGAFQLTGLRNNLILPRVAPIGNYNVVGENANAPNVDAATGAVSLSPRRIAAHCTISEQLATQSSVAVETLFLMLLMERLELRKDQYALQGTGTGSPAEPLGLFATNGIGSVAGGTNGLAPNWGHIVGLETAVANVNSAGNVYVTNSRVRGRLKQTQQAANLPFIWGADNTMNGYRTEVSNVVPNNLNAGTSVGVCSAIIHGDFSKMIHAYWGGLIIDNAKDSANAIAGTRTIVLNQYFDIGILQPAAFAVMLDALTA